MATVAPAPLVAPPARRRRLVASPGAWVVWGLVAFFLLNVAGVIGSVVVNSFGRRWFGGWLPEGFTTEWYSSAWSEFTLQDVLFVTLEVSLAVVVIALLVGVPAAYALARRDFPGKQVLMLTLLLPVVLPPIAYGIPLATVLYAYQLAGTLTGVILANLVPAIPFVILVMTPFIEQVDPNLERAARMCGARTHQVLLRVLAPLLVPGILAAGVLVLVRTLAMFELTFLTAGSANQTLVVALYYAVFAAGIRPGQSVDAMAVIYMLVAVVLLVVALRFVNPTQLVAQVGEEPQAMSVRRLVRSGADSELLDVAVAELAAGEALALGPDDPVRGGERGELMAVVLNGRVSAEVDGEVLGVAGGRAGVFDEPGHGVYAPPGAGVSLTADEPASVALVAAPVDRGRPGPARIVGPEDQRIATVGSGNWARTVRTMLGPEHAAGRLLLGETINPPGNWSSYPPHKHDEQAPPDEVRLEEVYLYKLDPAGGFGVQLLYDYERGREEVFRVNDGDAAVIASGYHPVVAAPGYQLYYLWALAGEAREMAIRFEPEHVWVQEQPADSGS